jgi:hypothetical protein
VGQARTVPSVRPLPIGEAEANLSVGVTKSIVQGESTGCGVQFQQVEALGVFRGPHTGSHHEALRFGVPPCPMRSVGIASGPEVGFWEVANSRQSLPISAG